MSNYLLSDYSLSGWEALQSIFVSEIGLRHLDRSWQDPAFSGGNKAIACIELIPVLGFLVSLVEAGVAHFFQHSEKPTFIFRSTQERCDRTIPLEKAREILSRLKQLRPKGIDFSDEPTDSTSRGTCAAMSVSFIQDYNLLKRQKTPEISRLRLRFAASSEEMRALQAAFDAIKIDPTEQPVDITRALMESLARFRNLTVSDASSEIDLRTAGSLTELRGALSQMKDGTYLINLQGNHACVYIRENGTECFFDPNSGVQDLRGKDHAQEIFQNMRHYFLKAEGRTPHLRLYRLEQTQSPTEA